MSVYRITAARGRKAETETIIVSAMGVPMALDEHNVPYEIIGLVEAESQEDATEIALANFDQL